MNSTIDLLMKRRSVRAYRDEAITEDHQQAILQAMRRAPTAGNQTLFSVIVVADRRSKAALADSCDHQPFIARAPWVLLFLADVQRMYDYLRVSGVDDVVSDGESSVRPEEGDLLLACCDAVIAAHTAVTAADALGIGSCYVGDILENYERIRSLFDLPPYTVPITLVTLGYPRAPEEGTHAPGRRRTGRMELDRFVFYDRYQRLDDRQVADLYAYNDRGTGSYVDGAGNLGQHIYLRKFSAPFMVEMRRSVRAMLDNWRG